MRPLRLPHRRKIGDGWFAGILSSWQTGDRHTMCFYVFRQFFKIPPSVKVIDLVITKKDPEYDGAYRMRIIYRPSRGRYGIEWYDDNKGKWKLCPFTTASVEYLTDKIGDHWKRTEGTYYVWVEYD